jgi:hypothetical protein
VLDRLSGLIDAGEIAHSHATGESGGGRGKKGKGNRSAGPKGISHGGKPVAAAFES